ncbi:MAG: exo-alpha-sialidase [Acidobacteria bacterium]|nr:exo-alpha-sialidase [Acidobacteriota bacterium]
MTKSRFSPLHADGHQMTAQAFKSALIQGALALLFAPVAHAAPTITAAITQRVHPVLIRNDHNELLELVVKVRGGDPPALRTLTCSLDGVGVLHLELLADNKPIAMPVKPSSKITFAANHPLREGDNVFTLSGTLKPDGSLSGQIAASCSTLNTSAGPVTIQAPPPVRRRIGVALRKHNDDGVHTYRIPAMTATPKGTLLTVYDMRRRMSRDLQEDIDIGLSRSTDGGRTWESPRVIMDMGEYGGLPQEQNGCSDPGIIVDPKTGEIFVFAVWMNGKPGKHQWRDDGSEPGYEIGKAAQMMLVRSRDDGRTWSRPENLTRKLKKEAWWLLAPSPQAGISLPKGTLIMPVEGRDEKGTGFATIMTSNDHGGTWSVATPAYSGGNECQAAQLSDGSIMLNIRNGRQGYRAVMVTSDLGRTWRAHSTHGNTLIEPPANGSLYRIDHDGKPLLLFANPRSQKARSHHTLQVSLDDGRTWPEKHHLLLDESRGRGYPSITRIDAEHIGIVYEGSRADFTFERIRIATLLRKD